jgi:hypothetical protein
LSKRSSVLSTWWKEITSPVSLTAMPWCDQPDWALSVSGTFAQSLTHSYVFWPLPTCMVAPYLR